MPFGFGRSRKKQIAWPPYPGLLESPKLVTCVTKPRSKWTRAEWRAWAEFLETRGKKYVELANELLSNLPVKKRRGRKPKPGAKRKAVARGLLDAGRKPGRTPLSTPEQTEVEQLYAASVLKNMRFASVIRAHVSKLVKNNALRRQDAEDKRKKLKSRLTAYKAKQPAAKNSQ